MGGRHRGPGLGRPPRGRQRDLTSCHLERQRAQPQPKRLRQGRRSVEEHPQAREEPGRQCAVRLESRDEHRVAHRHVEVGGRGVFRQGGEREREQRRRGLAVVDVQRPAVGQDHVQIVVATEGVAPGQPVDQHRGLVGQERPDLAHLLLVRAQHPVGVQDALRRAGRPGREQDLGDGGRPDGRVSVLHRCRRSRDEELGQRVRAGDDFRAGGGDGGQSRAESVVLGEHQSRPSELGDRPHPRVVRARERVRDADGYDRDARRVRAEGDQRVGDRVAGQHDHRAVGPEPAVEEGLREGGSALQRCCVGQGVRPPADQDPVAVRLCPCPQPLAERAGVRPQRVARGEQDGPVRPVLPRDLGYGEQTHVSPPHARRGPPQCRPRRSR